MTDKDAVPEPSRAWEAAVRLVARWIDTRERVDRLMEAAPSALAPAERARCQHLVFGAIRNAGRLDGALRRLIAHPPRFVTRAALLTAGFELIENPENAAKIVHHAVERTKTLASPAEARMVNAVVRKLAALLKDEAPPPRLAPAEALAEFHSHPLWLVRRWLTDHGARATRALLEWNQTPPTLYARRRKDPLPDWFLASSWPGFYEVPPGRWPEVEALLASGQVYLQDPATRIPIDLLDPKPGESILDVCASPGGKSLLIADRLCAPPAPDGLPPDAPAPSTLIVAMDLPGERIERLKENLSRAAGVATALVPADILSRPERALAELGLPVEYPAVVLDVPCSNTGVMRHRIDVRWRLEERDFRTHAGQQLALLQAAARLVAPGGRLVYSTCSIDPEENDRVVEAFLKRLKGFALERREVSYPWDSGHDGAAAFLLRRAAGAPAA